MAQLDATKRNQTQNDGTNLKTGVRKDSWVRIPPPPLEEPEVLRSVGPVEAPLRSNPRDFRRKAHRGFDPRGVTRIRRSATPDPREERGGAKRPRSSIPPPPLLCHKGLGSMWLMGASEPVEPVANAPANENG